MKNPHNFTAVNKITLDCTWKYTIFFIFRMRKSTIMKIRSIPELVFNIIPLKPPRGIFQVDKNGSKVYLIQKNF